MKSLEDVLAADLCSGCGACALLFPEKVGTSVGSGYMRPVLRHQLTDEEARDFRSVCPAVVVRRPDGRADGTWGHIEGARLAAAGDPKSRRMGSSGGALTALAAHLLDSGLVDAVVQVHQDAQDALGSAGTVSTSPSEVLAAAGSRYAPGTPLVTLRRALERYGRLCIVGKPCDISAMRAVVRERPELAKRVPYLLSFFCAGVPSRQSTIGLAVRAGVRPEDVRSIRYRGDGWPGRTRLTVSSGQEVSFSYEEAWGQVLNQSLQNRCKLCADAIGESADVVAADYWEVNEAGYPVFANAEGQSLLLERNALGEQLVSEAINRGVLRDLTAPGQNLIKALPKIQRYQYERRIFLKARLLGRRLAGLPVPSYPGFRLGAHLRRQPIQQARQLLGSFKRARRSSGA